MIWPNLPVPKEYRRPPMPPKTSFNFFMSMPPAGFCGEGCTRNLSKKSVNSLSSGEPGAAVASFRSSSSIALPFISNTVRSITL